MNARVHLRLTQHSKPFSQRGTGEEINITYCYFREIDKIPLLTAEDEVTLARQIEAGRAARSTLAEQHNLTGDKRTRLETRVAAAQQARRRMIESNSRLVASIARRYMGHGVALLDLIQEGYLGLMDAIERFDYRRGCKLSTYATFWIRQAVARAVAEQGPAVRVPASANRQRTALARAAGQLSQTLGRDPTVDELGRHLEVDPDQIRWAVETWRDPVSLEDINFGDEDSNAWAEYITDRDARSLDEIVEQRQLHEDIRGAMMCLTAREEQVLRLRYGLKDGYARKLAEIAEQFGVTRERVRQIELQALKKLREAQRYKKLQDYIA